MCVPLVWRSGDEKINGPGWNKIPCRVVYTNRRNTLDTRKGNATMKWNRLLAGAVCASLLSVPVWAVEGGEAPAAGAGQTSSTACGVTLDGVCLDLSEAPAAPYQENGQEDAPAVEGGPGPGMDCDLAAGRERDPHRK